MTTTTLQPTEPFEELRKKELVFHLFGKNISHSKSPVLQNEMFRIMGLNWTYQTFDSTDISEFETALKAENCIGSAVTMPNKIAFLDRVDLVDAQARGVGSINTVYTRKDGNGKTLYIGTNTDTVGVYNSFLKNPEAKKVVDENRGKPGLVYGGGGACRSAVYALYAFLGCSMIYIVNRDEEEVRAVSESMHKGGFKGEIIHVSTPEQAEALAKPSMAVLTVPDFAPTTESELQARATLDVFLHAKQGAVLEMCYHPRIYTTLYKDFQAEGWNVISGVEAMIYQGIAQQQLWTGYSLDELPVKQAIDFLYKCLEAESKE
ncbi:hypothetical protein BABINDRAFT_159701 [Babjeviella inositovora NRRL Y-12698]|uniref:Shikimate dehydrogenase substrate binding N-terminal domain-containing protein n=1 Tax=Babjeviella inositovora NRRL Y-12698 TaxID=984486 RepID=A0A1E3R051_9ASCO|nr:uncharacterized protein BABINDRAFT_159701 [Babjeviella inositovora NRRL Y-12698]ODQ83269.1 hypothetical protein BABINDRAFT_159701 [Babjeviella inositovora NRRL Y-12698]